MTARKVLKKITLEELETNPSHLCEIWRTIRGRAMGCSTVDAGKVMGSTVNPSALARLVREGWLVKSGGKGLPHHPNIYKAREDVEVKAIETPGRRLQRVRGRMTKLTKLAHDALYSQDPPTMCATLRRIEAELPTLRQELYAGRTEDSA